MNVLWIIGNGFDLNLGLQTGYQHFLRNAYIESDSKDYQYRDELIKRVNNNPLLGSDNWSDLEKLLGEATLCYEEDKELFHSTFEEMGEAFAAYIGGESDSFFSREISDECVSELWDSIANFPNRLSELDRQSFGAYKNKKDSITYQFVSLNYTKTLETMLNIANENHSPFSSRYLSGTNYHDKTAAVLHPHGTLENNEMVFGVNDESQLLSGFFQDDESRELWIKNNINAFFGNRNAYYLHKCIQGADQVFLFGLSLGESDKYIWEQIGKWLTSTSTHNLVFFSHDFPKKEPFNRRRCQKARIDTLENIRKSFSISEEDYEAVKDRILVLPSETVFRFNIDLND